MTDLLRDIYGEIKDGNDQFKEFLRCCVIKKILEKDSNSDCLTFVAAVFDKETQEEINVFVKIVLHNSALQEDYLDIEPDIYMNHINSIYEERESPHVMVMLDSIQITKVSDLLIDHSTELSNAYYDYLEKAVKKRAKKDSSRAEHATVLFLEYVPGRQLERLIGKPELTDTEFFVILFQIFYTLTVLHNRAVTHYDLHLGNIFMVKEAEPELMVYFLNSRTYCIAKANGWFPKIFDWDHAYAADVSTSKQDKTRKRRMEKIGVINAHLPAFDVYYPLSLIVTHKKISPRIKDFVLGILQLHSDDTSSDPNRNIIKRVTKTSYNNSSDHYLLCHLRELLGNYQCDGPIEQVDVIPTAEECMKYIIEKKKISTKNNQLETFTLPKWDPSYSPGTTNWEERVFFINQSVRQKVQSFFKNNTFTPFAFA